MNLGVPLGSVWRPFSELMSQIKAPFPPDALRRVPGRGLGTILDGSGSYFCVFLTLSLMFFWLSFSIAFYMGYVWNVYEVGMAYALFVHELCQEIVGGNHGNTQGKLIGNLRKVGFQKHAQTRACDLE